MVSKQLLELLVCPVCHDRLADSPEQSGLCCERCRLMYPVRDGIPVMLPNEAQSLAVHTTGAARQ